MTELRQAKDILPTGYKIDWEKTGASNMIPVEQYTLAVRITALEAAIYAVRRNTETSGRSSDLQNLHKELVDEYELFYEEGISIDPNLYY